MTPSLASRLSRGIVRCYPRVWRNRYGAELLEVLDQHRAGVGTVLDLAVNAVGAHLDPANHHGQTQVRRLFRSPGLLVIGGGLALLSVVGALLLLPERAPEFGRVGVHGVVFSPDEKLVVTTTPGGTIWNVADPATPRRLVNFDFQGGPPAFSPDGRTLATGNDPVRLWNVADPARPSQIAALDEYPNLVRATLFSPDGRTLATGYEDTVVLWDVTDLGRPSRGSTLDFGGSPEYYRQPHTLTWMAMAFSPDGDVLANASGSNKVSLWNVTDPAHASHLSVLTGHTDTIAAVAFSPDGRLLATAADDGTVILWDVSAPTHPRRTDTVTVAAAPATTTVPGSISDTHLGLAFSPDGRTLTTIAANATVSRWDVTDPSAVRRVSTISRHTRGAGDVAFSADGRTVAGAAADGSNAVGVWVVP